MKKTLAFLLAVLMLISLAACSKPAQTKPVADIYSAIETSVALPEMLPLADEYIRNYYGIDTASLDEYIFRIASDVVRADTVILVRIKGDKTEVRDALELILKQKLAEMQNYLPDQYEIAKKSKVEVSGDLVTLVISPDRDAIYKIING